MMTYRKYGGKSQYDMLREKERNFKPCLVSLESLVPQNNFYRKVENKLDLSFVRELVKDKYCWWKTVN